MGAPGPIPKGRWSWEYERCLWCGTSKTGTHKGRGLCFSCFDKKRLQNPKRQESVKKIKERYYLKHKSDPEFMRASCERAIQWQKTERYRNNYLPRVYLRGKFKRFLLRKRKLRRDEGIEILIDGQRVKTPIHPAPATETDNTPYQIEIFKQIYLKMKTQ